MIDFTVAIPNQIPLGQAAMARVRADPGNPAPLAEQRSYTSAGQLAASALLQLTWDSAGRIAQITQQHMLPTQSTYRGIDGTFEFVKHESGVIYHRLFRSD
ncbi:hypothetical protein AVMA1855_25155 [Acidovorax sp. SUPP1855]|uniref:hypothetical protein n=1 Tax=Acidovorax sp. SUPP1855 TaxID=431774 RepID=UPI0023DE26EC|nr:hypothetical protein [Acidovorax sp. SUPP1855]GKS87505.1 hypothetical protein AVMA1855_25155 [Acidovorax sp. SUPP1855]